jgi:hypothetical protein
LAISFMYASTKAGAGVAFVILFITFHLDISACHMFNFSGTHTLANTSIPVFHDRLREVPSILMHQNITQDLQF